MSFELSSMLAPLAQLNDSDVIFNRGEIHVSDSETYLTGELSINKLRAIFLGAISYELSAIIYACSACPIYPAVPREIHAHEERAYFTGVCPVKFFEKDSETHLTGVGPANPTGV